MMHLNLAQKSILLNILLVGITAISITFFIYHTASKILVTHALKDLSKQVEREEIILTGQVHEIESDVRFLSETPPVRNILKGNNPNIEKTDDVSNAEWKDRLAIIFSTLMGAKPDYLQLRLLNKTGEELLRVDRKDTAISRIPDSKLQNKSKANYVKSTFTLNSKEIFLSEINLNREFGKIAIPHTPVLRAATPIYENNRLLGMVIINLDFGITLNRIETTFKNYDQLIYVTNDQGSFLIHPNPGHRFSFDLGHRHRIQETFPQLSSLYLSSNTEPNRTVIPEDDADQAIVSQKLLFDSLNEKRFINIVLTKPYSQIVATETAVLLDTGKIILFLIFVLVTLGYFFSRFTSGPLNKITTTITDFGNTNTYSPPTSILNRDDEIGILARAFHDQVETVTSTQASLKKLNASLEDEIDRRTKELQLSENKQRAVLGNIADGIITIDTHGIVQTFNPAAEKIFEYNAAEIVGKNIKTLMPAPYSDQHDTYLKNYSETGVARVIGIGAEVEGLRKDGTTFPLDLAISEMWIGDDLFYAGVVRDISERKRIDKMKNEFISTVSHELRTPLTSIRGSLGLITGGAAGELPKQATSLLNIAYKNTERLLLLINDILDLQKIESGNMPFDFKDIVLSDFINEAIESNEPFAKVQEVSLVLTNNTHNNTLIIGDHGRLLQVMNNLISNAAKFSPSASQIIIDISNDENGITISVVDKGPGIPEDFKDKIFQKFTQSDSSDTRQVGGTGLGLSIAKLIVNKHNGSIGYDSEIGKGSTFYIQLPYSNTSTNNLDSDASTTIHTKHILIIEDDADIATLLSLQLKQANYQTHLATSAEHAWELLQTQKFDAITLDIVLPGQDGVSFIKQLRQNTLFRDIPIIVISVQADVAKKELNGGAIGLIDWLNKPFSHSELKHRLEQTIKNFVKPQILYVEDDPDTQHIVRQILIDQADLTIAATIAKAKQLLASHSYDLVLLDASLPDGNGIDLLVDIEASPGKPPAVIFSANPVSTQDAERVSAVLVKSQTNNTELLETLNRIITS